jgi:hypothetical protein
MGAKARVQRWRFFNFSLQPIVSKKKINLPAAPKTDPAPLPVVSEKETRGEQKCHWVMFLTASPGELRVNYRSYQMTRYSLKTNKDDR